MSNSTVCPKCRKEIAGRVEQLTAIIGPGRKKRTTRSFHFSCFYPSVPTDQLPLPVMAYVELAALDPQRAASFFPDSSDQL